MNNPLDDDDFTVVPFVLVKKNGGEYDDEAFTAGWHLAILDARLMLAATTELIPPPMLLRSKWKKQADLIAMSHSMIVRTISTDDPEFLYFIFGTPDFFKESDE